MSAKCSHAALPAEEDVCFPSGGLSDIADEEEQAPVEISPSRPRRRRRRWPDLRVLDRWSTQERQERNDAIRAKRINEPMFVGGRLRPSNGSWQRVEEDAPYRFTYFNEEVQSTIHSQTISGLLQDGQTFRDLFIPEPPVIDSDSSDYDSDDGDDSDDNDEKKQPQPPHEAYNHTAGPRDQAQNGRTKSPDSEKPKRYGPRPTFWLDVFSPTDAEMRVISKAFGIHALTTEDIMMQEAREKVELFRHYYFINYRTFEQDKHSEHYLEPVNMYVIVFREGLLSFHFSMIPHPANVRRRIRQLKDYLILSADWISYALIDDITDVFGPMIQVIEDEVDAIDDIVLRLYSESSTTKPGEEDDDSAEPPMSGSDMLRRVGECRKKVMGLYRLLGNKADVIKGFAKRCNEYWEVAPKNEIGLYLGDIQDHIVTMTSNLSHYETYVRSRD
ncbi:CorA metal ion transporter [Ascosphaera acerosa]|nr:CorA metal ion transporter [Ascosphaera acerosa]